MKGTIRATVKWGAFPQKEKRFVEGTPQRVIKAWKVATLAKMMKRSPQPERVAKSGTLAADARRYYPLTRHLASADTRESEITAWLHLYGDRYRHVLTPEDILRARSIWLETGTKPKTINNRVSALRNLYRVLDGTNEPTPCDGIAPLAVQKTPIQRVDPLMVNEVMQALLTRAVKGGKGRPCPHAIQDRARLMVLAATGKRQCEVERAQPDDVNLELRVWATRDAKGGYSPGLYLNDDMVAAWQEFIAAEAWGPFPDHFQRRLQEAGWPPKVRVYCLRHSTWIAASEKGIDLADISAGAGHRRLDTTRRHYVPVLDSRMQRMSEAIDHRFGWAKKDDAVH